MPSQWKASNLETQRSMSEDDEHILDFSLLSDFAGVLLLRRKVISKDFEDCAKKLTYLDLQEFEGIAAAGISETAAAALRRWL